MYCWICTSRTCQGGERYWKGLCAQCNAEVARLNYHGAPLPCVGTLLYRMYDQMVATEQSYYARSIHVGKSLGGRVVQRESARPNAKEQHAMWIVSYICDQLEWDRPITTYTCPPIHLDILEGRDTEYQLRGPARDVGDELPELPMLPD